MSEDTKPTNPKDMAATSRLPMHLVPSTVEVLAALAFAEGAAKYGAFNWRVAGVSFQVYLGAIKRHLAKLQNGEWADPKTRVPHLASIIACCGILGDAKLCGKLNDDRPPAAPMSAAIDAMEADVAHIFAMFADRNPKQWTIENSAPAPEVPEFGW